MNILIPDSWLRQFLETPATADQIKECLSLCGPSVERVNKEGRDFIYEIEITTNRIDMVSVYGIAREAAAILPRFGFKAKLVPYDIPAPPKAKNVLPVEILDPQRLCHRLLAIVLDNINLGPSPDFVKERLEKSGVRCLNNVIDITNYVMLETGYPTHAFDYDRIKTRRLLLRRAKKGEIFVSLDQKKYLLTDEDVIIDDGTGTIIDLPGIMGAQNSVVTGETKRIIFFTEANNPVTIRQTSMRLGLHTLAANINEKRPDPSLALTALFAGARMYRQITQAKVANETIDIYPHKLKSKKIEITPQFVSERLGINLEIKEIVQILESLSFQVTVRDKLEIVPPSFRQYDILIPEDIVEEVARIYGYHRLPSKLMTGQIPPYFKLRDLAVEQKLKQMLKYQGFTECYHYSFVSKELIEKAGLVTSDHLRLANPLTQEIEYLRQSLIPSLLSSVNLNQVYKETLRLFELAKVYLPQKNNLPQEISMLAVATQSDFSHTKGLAEYTLAQLGVTAYETVQGACAFFHPKQSLTLFTSGKILGFAGKVHPSLSRNFSLKKETFLIELNLDLLVELESSLKQYVPLPLFPPAFEDLTFRVLPEMKLGVIIADLKKIAPVTAIDLLDKYQDTVTLRFTYQDRQKNLTGKDLVNTRKKILAVLSRRFQISLKTKE